MNDQKRVIFSTQGYWFDTMFPSGAVRLQDSLRDKNSQFIRLESCRICKPGSVHTSVHDLRQTTIVKEKILFAMILDSKNDPPGSRRGINPMPKIEVNAFVCINEYSIQGTLHLSKLTNDPVVLLNSELASFFAMTNASLGCNSMATGMVPVVFVNRASVGSLSMLSELNQPTLQSSKQNSFDSKLSAEDKALEAIQSLLTDPGQRALKS